MHRSPLFVFFSFLKTLKREKNLHWLFSKSPFLRSYNLCEIIRFLDYGWWRCSLHKWAILEQREVDDSRPPEKNAKHGLQLPFPFKTFPSLLSFPFFCRDVTVSECTAFSLRPLSLPPFSSSESQRHHSCGQPAANFNRHIKSPIRH